MSSFSYIARSQQIVLSGPAVYESLFTAQHITTVKSIRVTYDEASSSNTGVTLRVGKVGDSDYFASHTSEVSKSLGYSKWLTLSNTMLAQDEVLTIECDGDKVGTGIVSIQIDLRWTLNE